METPSQWAARRITLKPAPGDAEPFSFGGVPKEARTYAAVHALDIRFAELVFTDLPRDSETTLDEANADAATAIAKSRFARTLPMTWRTTPTKDAGADVEIRFVGTEIVIVPEQDAETTSEWAKLGTSVLRARVERDGTVARPVIVDQGAEPNDYLAEVLPSVEDMLAAANVLQLDSGIRVGQTHATSHDGLAQRLVQRLAETLRTGPCATVDDRLDLTGRSKFLFRLRGIDVRAGQRVGTLDVEGFAAQSIDTITPPAVNGERYVVDLGLFLSGTLEWNLDDPWARTLTLAFEARCEMSQHGSTFTKTMVGELAMRCTAAP